MLADIIRAITNGHRPFQIFSILLLISIFFWLFWGSKIGRDKEAKRDKKIDSIQEISKQTHQLLLQQLKEASSENHFRLMTAYPLGYCLFAVDHKSIIIPYESQLESDYEIDWTTAKITKLTSEEVVIRLPKIHDKVDHIMIEGIAVETSRQVGSVRKHFAGYGPQIYTEVVENDEKGVIIALGFKQRLDKIVG